MSTSTNIITFTAVAEQDLEAGKIKIMPNKITLHPQGPHSSIIPDTYAECIGRLDITDNKVKSFFTEDKKNNNTEIFDYYKDNFSVKEVRHMVGGMKDNTIRPVIDYYILYSIAESSKNIPTVISCHPDHSYCISGYYDCTYELLFACEGSTRRIIVPYKCNNIPMYQFIEELEDMADEIFNCDIKEDNPLDGLLEHTEFGFAIIMLDEIGRICSVEVENAKELLAMLVSVRLVKCKFIKTKKL